MPFASTLAVLSNLIVRSALQADSISKPHMSVITPGASAPEGEMTAHISVPVPSHLPHQGGDASSPQGSTAKSVPLQSNASKQGELAGCWPGVDAVYVLPIWNSGSREKRCGQAC